ncbi:MAG: HU family DNA-binding protein [Planctomycetes bacterium]|nr:HU family DNA-binding protein [Planctomycetota bacterium]
MAKAKKKAANSKKPRTKSEVYAELAEGNALTRKQVSGVFSTLTDLIKRDLAGRGPGTFNVPGLMKIKVVKKKATKARKGINPFTGEEIMIKAKPARKVVKVQALKGLKEMV